MNENPRAREHRGRSLTFAVKVRDAFSGDDLAGNVDVDLLDHRDDPAQNQSGYYTFIDLDADAVVLSVDGGDEYYPYEKRIVTPSGDPDDAGPDDEVITDALDPMEIELTPTPAYPFDDSATTIRGMVTDAEGDPVEGATVSVPEFDLSTRTTEDGEFAVMLAIGSEDVVKEDGRKVVKVAGDGRLSGGNGSRIGNGNSVAGDGGGDDPTLEITHPDAGSSSERLTVEAGTRTVHNVTLQ